MIIIFFLQLSGIPGAGKSTLALEIAKHINVIIIDHDVTKSAVMNSGLSVKDAAPISWDVGYAYVDFYLSQGRNVIMDSCCFYNIQLIRSIKVAEKNNAEYKYIECYLNNLEEVNRRIKTREGKPSQIKFMEHKDYHLWVDDMKRPEQNVLVVNTSKPIETYLNYVISYLCNIE